MVAPRGAVSAPYLGGPNGPGRGLPPPPGLRGDHARGRLVAPHPPGVRGALRLRGLRDLGGPAGRPLPLGPVPLAVLFPGAVRAEPARVVRPAAGVVAGVAALLAGRADPVDPRALPRDLLLL